MNPLETVWLTAKFPRSLSLTTKFLRCTIPQGILFESLNHEIITVKNSVTNMKDFE